MLRYPKILRNLILIFGLLFSTTSSASHVLGGEIYWECLSNGNFIFYASVYRDCTGITYPFQNQGIDIVGTPLPRDANNANISQIVVKPDSAKWAAYNFGDQSPECGSGGSPLSCQNASEGAAQKFYYKSDPIQLRGNIPANGWRFYFQQPCCRPNVTNLAGGGTQMVRAHMFRGSLNSTNDGCIDSSPQFIEDPNYLVCRGLKTTLSYSALDKDLDSLAYHWDRTYNTPPAAPQPVPYANGYNFTNPFPDQSFDPSNIPASLNSTNGLVEVKVNSGSPNVRDYFTVVRVDAWRSGQLLSSNFREIPVLFYDCPQTQNNEENNMPEVRIGNEETLDYEIVAAAGQKVNVPIQLRDIDQTGTPQPFQKITVLPYGSAFSRDFQDNTYCRFQGNANCATLQNNPATFNSLAMPARYELSNQLAINSEFDWQTSCENILSLDRPTGSNESNYEFFFLIQDDHCPIPAHTAANITVRLKEPSKLDDPYVMGLSINLDGSVRYQWVPPRDTANTFSRYYVEYSQPSNAVPPQHFLSIDTNERKYQQERGGNFIRVYNPNPQNPNENNILNPIQGKDFYLRMKTLSGCKQNQASSYSNLGRVMELAIQARGQSPDPLYSRLELRWNAPRDQNQAWNDNMISKSQTIYYVWQTNDLSNLGDPSVWSLRDSTYNTSTQIASNICNSIAAYRIEARDTVYTYRKTTSLNNDVFDTLYFSTFSMIDTIPAQLAKPRIQTVGLERLETDILASTYQWFDCSTNQLIPNAGNRSYVPQKPGFFKVFIESDGCVDTSACFYVDSIANGVDVLDNHTLQARSNQYQLQWIDCRMDTILGGETGLRLNLQDTGYYALVSYAYGFSDTSECLPMLSVSIASNSSFEEGIKIYPNPSNGLVHIQHSLNREFELTIYNVHGLLIKQMQLQPSIKYFRLPEQAGSYLIKIIDYEGNVQYQKIIRE